MSLDLTENEISLMIIQSLKDGKKIIFQETIDELQPYDIVQQYLQMPSKHKNKFLQYLSIEQLTDLIQGLDKKDQLNVLQKLGIEKSTKVLDLMDNDDLVHYFQAWIQRNGRAYFRNERRRIRSRSELDGLSS